MLSDVKSIDRMKQKQPGHDGLMCEMLWTDPQDAVGRGPSKRVCAFFFVSFSSSLLVSCPDGVGWFRVSELDSART